MRSKKENELFFSLANSFDNIYMFEHDMRTGISHWSDNAIEYFGLPNGYEKEVTAYWIPSIHPDDRVEYVQDIDNVFSGKSDRHQVQYRVKNRYGDYVWVECIGSVIRDQNDEPDVFAGMIVRLDNQTKYDSLTKKLSGHQFHQMEELTESGIVMLIEIDGFRKVLHNYGYETGNNIICHLADLLSKPKLNQRIYRMNGASFLVVLPRANKREAGEYFNEIFEQFKNSNVEQGLTSRLVFSGAADTYPEGGCDKGVLIKRLEHSMEQAKFSGGGKLIFFSKKIENAHKRIADIASEMEYSLTHDFAGFEVYYQPIITVATGEIKAVEALLRFHSQTLGPIPPCEFIPILENTRMISQVGLFVMRSVIKQNKIWNEKYTNIRTAFNVSSLQLINRQLVDELKKEVKKQGVNPASVILELTESCKVKYPESLSAMFKELMEEGFFVALDDFGMEYSNLALLRELKMTTIKIDHSFVRTITDDMSDKNRANLAIIKGIITICKELNYNVVVEGIETETLAELMTNLGAEFLQGYLYARPIRACEVEKLFV